MIRHRRFLLVALLLSTIEAAQAQSPAGFQTPSKNIACQYFDIDGQNTLRCDISQMNARPPRPADFELDWGGCQFWRSTDGNTYAYARTIYRGGRQGVLTSALPSSGEKDVGARQRPGTG